MINNTTAMFAAVAGLGVGSTATTYIAQLRNEEPRRAGRIAHLTTQITWMSGMICGGIIMGLAPWLADQTLAAPHLTMTLMIAGISVALNVINSNQLGVLAGCEAFSVTALINSSCAVGQCVLVLAGAALAGVYGAIVGMALAVLGTVLVTHALLKRELLRSGLRSGWREAWEEWPVLLRFSLPAFLVTLSAAPVFWFCNALLARQPGGYAELGMLNAANQWYNVIAFLPGVMTTALLPVLAERHGRQDERASIRVMTGMVRLSALIVIPLVAGVCALSTAIMGGYGASFRAGSLALIITVLAAGIHSVITPCWFYLMAHGRMWSCMWVNLVWSLIFALATVGFLAYGAAGVAGARLGATVIQGIALVGIALLIARRQDLKTKKYTTGSSVDGLLRRQTHIELREEL